MEACPDENELMAMVEHTLDQHQQHALELHLDSCESCRRVAAAAVAAGATAIGTPPERLDAVERASHIRIEGYAVESLLGKGGMGAVYLARDVTLGREVAIKLHGAGSGNDRLHREAIAMAKLAHPNVVTVFEIANVEDRLYVAMEYVRGGTLRSWLADKPRTWREIVDLLVKAGEGLAAAHAAELVHRDFKPENVLVGDDGRPRVSDFGLARVDKRPSGPIAPLAGTSSLDTPMTMTGELMGTPAYMSPEQLAGDDVDARTDQFAFCVVAWEALYGARPFTGSTLAALAQAIERQGLVRPDKTQVPLRVHDVITRGLLVDRTARYPDMTALLAALREAASPRTRRVAFAGGAAVVIAGAAVAFAMTRSSAPPPCESVGDPLADSWSPALHDKMTAAFTASGIKDASAKLERVATAIGAYRTSWIDMRRSACEATRVRGEQSEALLDLRVRCLDRKHDELREVTRALAEADRPAVLGSVRAALGLSPVSECADVAGLSAPVRPPDAQIRDRVDAERSELATINALRLLGRIKPAVAKIDEIDARAKDLKYKPLEAEILLMRGDLADRAGDSAAAIPLLQQAVVAADAGNHKLVAAQAWSNIAWVEGSEERHFDRADFAVHMAAAAIEGLGGNAELSAQLTNYEALILETKGQLDAAKAKYLEALAARERMGMANSWQISLVLNDLGGVERRLGDLPAAREHHERALAIRTQLFGELHPYVFSSLINLGNVAWSGDNYTEAEARFRAALRVADEVFPEKHPQRALGFGNLASVLERQGKYEEALTAYHRSLEIYEAVRGPDHPDVGDVLHNMGNVQFALHREDDAIKSYERARTILEKAEDDAALAGLLYDYGDVLRKRDPHRAESLLQRAIDLEAKATTNADSVGYPLTALAEIYADSGRAEKARPLLERALTLRTGKDAPEERARTEFALAKILWPDTRANALMAAAKTDVAGATATRKELQDAIATWLATHH